MKSVAMIMAFMACAFTVSAQPGLNGLGVGFDFNGGGNFYSESLFQKFDNTFNPTQGRFPYVYYDQLLTTLTVRYRGKKREYIVLEADLLQGAESLHGTSINPLNNPDTVKYYYSSFDITSSVLGLSALAHISEHRDKRIHLKYGIGPGFVYAFNNRVTGSNNYVEHFHDSAYHHNQSYELSSYEMKNYYTLSIIQQAALGLRLSMKEKHAPFHRTYIEAGFLFRNNFTIIEKNRTHHRSYGISLSIVYEFKP